MTFRIHVLVICSTLLLLPLHTLDALQPFSRQLSKRLPIYGRPAAPAQYCPTPVLKQTPSVRSMHTSKQEEAYEQKSSEQGAKGKAPWKAAAAAGAGSVFFAQYCTTVSQEKEKQKEFFDKEAAELAAEAPRYLKLAQAATQGSLVSDMYYAAYYAALGNKDELIRYINLVQSKIAIISEVEQNIWAQPRLSQVGMFITNAADLRQGWLAISILNDTDALNVVMRGIVLIIYRAYSPFLEYQVPHTIVQADLLRPHLTELPVKILQTQKYTDEEHLKQMIVSLNAFADNPTREQYDAVKKILPIGKKPAPERFRATEQLYEQPYPDVPNPYWLD